MRVTIDITPAELKRIENQLAKRAMLFSCGFGNTGYGYAHYVGGAFKRFRCPYGVPGDRLWVRETHHIDYYPAGTLNAHGNPGVIHYRADTDIISQSWDGQWRPSIYMPRWASRITLEVVSVRVERVQDITPSDCIAEGVEVIANEWGTPWYKGPQGEWKSSREAFSAFWNSINAKRGFPWSSNPWVWVVEFRQVE